ncbi:unnamed protein product [Medioppia subpectinata]|uniref:Histone-lysine N-methyltransferase n=1 Tax=Medioppia subpectinata TaxID=1979941 RepID=A0A7R9KNR9_9ACAR|nr:unnamed protein product [Medioppia subpectinata]CAG2105578.1 unnamed protein product [Medioppia subpectinata]
MGRKRHISDDELDANPHNEEAVGSDGQYWAEAVVDWCVDEKGVMMYLVKWYGYGDDQNSWEVQQHINECEELLIEFHLNHIFEGFGPKQINECEELLIEFHLNHVNGRQPPKCSFDEFDKLLRYLKDLVQNIDFAVVKRFTKKPIDCFEIRNNDEVMDQIIEVIKTQIDILSERKQNLKIRTNSERIKVREVVLRVAKSLHLTANFDSISGFLDFVDKRKDLVKELEVWEKTQNAIIERESEGRPIRVVNDVDLEIPNLKAYITNCILDVQFGQNIRFEDEEPLVGCECDDCYECKDECCTAVVGFPMVYNRKGVLNHHFNTVIYECNAKCKCGDNCPNRQIQKGRQFDLEIFRSDSKSRGWGVRAGQDIPKGAFITHYVGEVISVLEADKRPTTYLFDLSAHLDSSDAEYTYVVDASQYGNITRFVNHSCDPNCRILFAWTKGLVNRFLPTVALFATKHIPSHEELTYDYSIDSVEHHSKGLPDSPILKLYVGQTSGPSTSRQSRGQSGGRLKRNAVFREVDCECGAYNCQKFMYS